MVARLNANYPDQELRPETAVEWFGALASFPAVEVQAAVERVRREREWMPTGVAVILNAIDANWDQARAAEREQQAVAARRRRNAGGGESPPAEFHEALELLSRTTLPPYHPKHLAPAEGRRLIEAVSDRLDARIDQEKREELFSGGGP
jgi:hypothetical protein